jgi:hypothetical protein
MEYGSNNNGDGRLCGTCNGETALRTSTTPKNPNRQFYSCADRNCGKFNGWANEAPRSGGGGGSGFKRPRQQQQPGQQPESELANIHAQFDQLRGIVTNMRLQIGQLSGNMDEMAAEIMALCKRQTEMQ